MGKIKLKNCRRVLIYHFSGCEDLVAFVGDRQGEIWKMRGDYDDAGVGRKHADHVKRRDIMHF